MTKNHRFVVILRDSNPMQRCPFNSRRPRNRAVAWSTAATKHRSSSDVHSRDPNNVGCQGRPAKSIQRKTFFCLHWWRRRGSRRNLRNWKIEQKKKNNANIRADKEWTCSHDLTSSVFAPLTLLIPLTLPFYPPPASLLLSHYNDKFNARVSGLSWPTVGPAEKKQ